MAINVKAGEVNFVVAKTDATFASLAAKINANSISIIYEGGAGLKSFVPGRPINGVTAFTNGNGYQIMAKQDIDLEDVLVPPVTGGGGNQLGAPTISAVTLDATTGNESVTIGWGMVNDAESYSVQRATNEAFTENFVSFNSIPLSYVDDTVVPGTNYFYRVIARATGWTSSDPSGFREVTAPDGDLNTGSVPLGLATGDRNHNVVSVGGGNNYASTSGAQLFDGYAQAPHYVPPAWNGNIQFTKSDNTNEGAVIAFVEGNVNERYKFEPDTYNYPVGVFVFGGNLNVLDNFTQAQEKGAVANGQLVRIRRTDDTFVAEVGDGMTWTTRHTFVYKNRRKLYIQYNIDSSVSAYVLNNPVGAAVKHE